MNETFTTIIVISNLIHEIKKHAYRSWQIEQPYTQKSGQGLEPRKMFHCPAQHIESPSHGTFQRIRINKSPTSAEKMPMAKARMACRKGLRVANLGRSQTVMEGYYEALLI
jgi:hypothetical protein